MSFNPAALNLNPRMASQLSMRYAAAAVAAQNHPRFPAQLRFPGNKFKMTIISVLLKIMSKSFICISFFQDHILCDGTPHRTPIHHPHPRQQQLQHRPRYR